jgi:hypothetical protein
LAVHTSCNCEKRASERIVLNDCIEVKKKMHATQEALQMEKEEQ